MNKQLAALAALFIGSKVDSGPHLRLMPLPGPIGAPGDLGYCPIIQRSHKTNWKNVAASKRAAKKRRKYLAKQPK